MFYEKFEKLCIKRGISPTTAAEECGFTSAAMSGWKKGAEPRSATKRIIADYFGVSVSYFENENAPARADADLKFALWGDASSDMDADDLDDVRRYAAFIRERKGKK